MQDRNSYFPVLHFPVWETLLISKSISARIAQRAAGSIAR